jgi:NADH-quinone oxidoreductase subunit G
VVSETTAKEAGVSAGGSITVRGAKGEVTLPVRIAEMPDRVVWLPTLSDGSHVHETLGVVAGDVVTLAGGAA